MTERTIQKQVSDGEFVVSEASGRRSREFGLISSGLLLPAGTVLGRTTDVPDGECGPLDPSASDGRQNAIGILYGKADTRRGALQSTYVAREVTVIESLLTWPDGISDADKATAVGALAAQSVQFC